MFTGNGELNGTKEPIGTVYIERGHSHGIEFDIVSVVCRAIAETKGDHVAVHGFDDGLNEGVGIIGNQRSAGRNQMGESLEGAGDVVDILKVSR